MVFHWSSSDSKSPQVSRTLLSIRDDLSNAVVWMVFTRLLILKSSSLCINYLVTVPRAPTTIGNTVTFMFHIFYSQARSRYLSFFSLSFNITLWSAGTAKFTILFLLIVWSRFEDPFVSQNPRGVCPSSFLGQILVCAYAISSYSQISFSCTIPSDHVAHPVVSSLTLFLC